MQLLDRYLPLLVLTAGFLLDHLLGDPPTWPHPVRWLGHSILVGERLLRSGWSERLAGGLLLLGITALAGGSVWIIMYLTNLFHPLAAAVLAVGLIGSGLAARNLGQEAQAVLACCQEGKWEQARQRLSALVGRDTQDLPPEEIYRACIESVAENTCDGVVAPLLYAALGGPVALWIYKAINTLDSMVGYRNERYRLFGWASARADDLANWVPARCTWLLLSAAALLAGQRAGAALRLGCRDGRKHPSPNAGWSEAAMAGALGVRLGGPSTYQGELVVKPYLGEACEPLTPAKVQQAIQLLQVASWLVLVAGLLLTSGVYELGGRWLWPL